MSRSPFATDVELRAVLLGDVGAGKTTLARFVADGKFLADVAHAANPDFVTATEIVGGRRVRLMLFDHTTSERFRCVPRMYLRRSHVIFVCFDMTNRESFNGAAQWVNDAVVNACDPSRVVLFGLKSDLVADTRAVSSDEARAIVDEHGIAGYDELSSKTGANVEESLWKHLSRFVDVNRSGSVRLPVAFPQGE